MAWPPDPAYALLSNSSTLAVIKLKAYILEMGRQRSRVLVTVGGRGLGLGIAMAYAERGDAVVAVCRTPTPELKALGVEIIDGIELGDSESVARVSPRLGPA